MSQKKVGALDKNIVDAVESFMLKITVPIFYSTADGLTDLIGTGTFFQIEERHFLITAAHLFDDIDPADLAVPQYCTGKHQLRLIGNSKLYLPSKKFVESVDIAIVEILLPDSINFIMSGWKSLTFDNISSPTAEGHFLLCGFPCERTKKDAEDFTGEMISVITTRLVKAPHGAKQPVNYGVDLFFSCDKSAFDHSGRQVSIPRLQGVSGASIWEIDKSENSLVWTPEKSLKVVGIQSSSLHGEFFRAKNWDYVSQMFGKIDPKLLG